MKRVLLVVVALVVLLAAAAAGIPVWLGMQTETLYNERVAQLERDGLKSVRFERGLYSSSAETRIEIPGYPLTIIGKHEIKHGPLDLARGVDGLFSPVLALVDSELTIHASVPGKPAQSLGLPPLTVHTAVDLNGDGTATIGSPAGKKGAVEWKALTGEMSFDSQWSAVRMSLRAPEITVGAPLGKVAVSGVTIDMDIKDGPSGYPVGDMGFSVAKATMDPVFRMEGLSLRSQSRETGGNLGGTVRYRFNTLQVGPEKIGPAQLDVEVRKFDAKTMAKLDKTIKELQQRKMPDEQRAMIMMGHLLDLLGDLAKKAPEIEVTKLSVKLPSGEIAGRGKIVVDGSNMNVKENPMLFMNALSAEGEVSVPASVLEAFARKQVETEIMALRTSGKLSGAEQAKLTPQKLAAISDQVLPQRVDAIAQKMHLVRQNGTFSIKTSLKRGQLLVNGQPFERSLPLPK